MSPQHRTARSARVVALTALAALAAGTLTAAPAAAGDAAVRVTVRLDPSYQQQPFQGWGTALAWFANATGNWPDAKRTELADALYGADGLGFTVARYNIGGGDSPETAPYMRPGAAVPGYWNRPAAYGPPGGAAGWTEQPNWWDPGNPDHWNPQADAAQRWWLTAAKSRGADTFEAFSNSAPYFMTDSGLVSGAVNGSQDNLRADQYDRFAAYLAGSLQRAQAATGVTFGSLSPMNEPGTSYWHAGGPQEGSHWDTASQTHLATSVRAALDAAHLATPVAAMDETDPALFRTDWSAYPAAARAAVGKLNTHTYSTGGRGVVRDLAKGGGLPAWMSEVDLGGSAPQSFTDMAPALDFAHRITDDVRELEPGAWVMWQAVEDYTNMTPGREDSNWGLVQVDLNSTDPANEPLRRNKKYWAMANYSRFVRPGARVIASDSTDTLAALRPNGAGAVAVYTNSSATARTVTFDLAGFQSVDASAPVQQWTTDGGKDLVRGVDLTATAAKTLTATVGPGSVTTFVLPGVSGTATAAATVPTGQVRRLVNDRSGLALAASGAAVVQRVVNAADTAQQWNFARLAGTYDSTAAYRITNAKSGKALSVAGSTLGFATAGGSTQQQWVLSTTGDGRDTLVNRASGLLLDVTGQSTADGAPVGAWQPTGGTNQSWAISSAAADAYKSLKVRLSGRCAEVAGGSTTAGAAVVQHTCASAADQQWTLRPGGGPGQVNVVVRATGQCLDVSGASTADGAPLVQYPCNGGANQQWSVRDTGSGYVTLLARHSGECLDVDGSSTADGAALVQRPCTAALGQQLLVG
ncbi:RICIN domain-containing protein [Streptomyces sp. TLI_171]|uniref:RICIN domain-containing protein n=1 Tax=Streptomyces sp. TLI_171 TaxID=1938859 RepID=UPI000C1A4A83|nr:RICIN domain-containing protein [Streptomyces sp. TLI_171]RKE05139.1 O-glycosyl hydrolase [Streptomyces sp. TLI_171]